MLQIQHLLEQVLRENPEKNSSCICQKSERIHSEQHFKDELYKERKRTERTKSPLTVLFLNFSRLYETNKKNGVKVWDKELISIISECTRVTDYAGWYECNRILGIIYTDTTLDDARKIVLDKVKAKIELKHSSVINAEVDCVAITFPRKEITSSDSIAFTIYPSKKDTVKEKVYLSAKRMLDLFAAVGGILFFSPLFLLLVFLIKIDSKGPVFYVQKRVGEGGAVFNLYKFRSMRTDANDSIHRDYVTQLIKGCAQKNSGVYKIKDDPRVTRVGKYLRKYSLDELPQFFNVLKGQMSIVGPRPPIPYETAEYDLWHLRRVMECKPGVTGLWQVEGRSKTNFDDMVRLDLKYIQKRSFLLDLLIIVKTPWALMTTKGAF